MGKQERPADKPATDQDQQVAPATANGEPRGHRADREPTEGPGPGGGSALTADDPAAEEEIGGGD